MLKMARNCLRSIMVVRKRQISSELALVWWCIVSFERWSNGIIGGGSRWLAIDPKGE